MTISKMLQAIREAVNDLDIDTLGKNVPTIETQLDTIQAAISSAETDAGKVVVQLSTQATILNFLEGQPCVIKQDDLDKWATSIEPAITTAILAQREKYDALIAKAEGDAEKLADELVKHIVTQDGVIRYLDIDGLELITAALLKAGQREWLPIETAPKDGTRIIIANSRQQIYASWCKIAENIYDWVGDYVACGEGGHVDMNDPPTHWCKSLPSPPSSQEGVGLI